MGRSPGLEPRAGSLCRAMGTRRSNLLDRMVGRMRYRALRTRERKRCL